MVAERLATATTPVPPPRSMAMKDPDLECGTETIHDDTAYHETADPTGDSLLMFALSASASAEPTM